MSLFVHIVDNTFALRKGTVIHVEGIPLQLEGDALITTHPENIALIERLAAVERSIDVPRSDASGRDPRG